MRVLVIKRKAYFSPNHVGNDAIILDLVCNGLVGRGVSVEVIDEEECLKREVIEQEFIVMMGRTKSLIAKLKRWEDEGKLIFNSPSGIERCFRRNMTVALLANGIPYPQSYIVDTKSDIGAIFKDLPGPGVWIKRGDFHAINKEDVTFASSLEHASFILKEYALRGIGDAVVSQHLIGDLLKFYAIRGTDFFYAFYPYEHNHHKYADYEQINGDTSHHTYDMDLLKQVAEESAEVLGVHIYGGDAIIGPDGSIHIIDLNDWPSFAPCRAEAAPQIADFLFNHFKKKVDEQFYTAKSTR